MSWRDGWRSCSWSEHQRHGRVDGDWALLDRIRIVSLAKPHGRRSQPVRPFVDRRTKMRQAQAMARRSTAEIHIDLRARLEAARLDLLALFQALDRMDLSPTEIPNA